MRAILIIDDAVMLERTLRSLEQTGQYKVLRDTPLPPNVPSPGELRELLHDEYQLTPREIDLTLIALQGSLSYSEIAVQQMTTRNTIKTYYHRIFHKLGIRRRAELYGLFQRDAPVENKEIEHDSRRLCSERGKGRGTG